MFPKLRFAFFAFFTILVNMTTFAGTNPFIASADTVVSCPADGSQLATFTICGASDVRSIQVNDPLVQSVQWQVLNAGTCTPADQDCPNLNVSCMWNTVSTSNSLNLNGEGEYRVILTYASAADEYFYAKAIRTTYSDVLSVTQSISGNGGSDGMITLSVTGDSGPYIHQLYRNGTLVTPFQSSPTFSGLTVGTYQIRTRDSSGVCEHFSAMVEMTEPELMVAQLAQTQLPSCNEGGTIQANVTGGIPPYQYALNGSPYSFSNIFTNLTVGSYVVDVIDANGIIATTNGITITNPATLDATFTNYDVSCFGEADGRIEVQAYGGSGVYQYQLSVNGNPNPLQASPIFENLVPGTYAILVQDSGGCVLDPNTIVIAEPLALDVTVSVVGATGNGAQDGEITINASGGAGSYQYAISPNLNEFYTAKLFTGLGAGNYTILIQDQNGCTYTTQANVNQPDTMTIEVTVIEHASCTADGAIEVSANGGIPPYEYSIDGGTLYNQMNGNPTQVNGLSPGMYQITIRDANGYVSISSAFIAHTPELTVDLISGKDITCNGDQDGRFEVGAQGGDGNYSFQLSDAEGNVIRNYQTSGVFDNLDPGEYVFNVVDTNGCIGVSFVYGIREAEVFIVGNISSQGDTFMPNTGSISFDISGGASPYSYSIDSSAFVSFDETSKTISGLAAGDYIVNVRDAYGCESSFTTTVDSSGAVVPITADIVVTDLSCAGNLDGSIQVNDTQGGSGEYMYALDTPDITQAQAANVFSGIDTGNHYIAIFDSNGYTVQIPLVVMSPEVLEVTAEVTYSGAFATIAVSAQGGTLPYSYVLNGEEDQEANIFENIAAGRYLVQVQDTNGCTNMTVVEVEENTDADSQQIDIFQNTGRTELIDIVFKETQNSETTIAVYNSRGNKVFSSEIEPGNSQTQLDVNNLSRGIYFIYIKNDEVEEVKKVMVL